MPENNKTSGNKTVKSLAGKRRVRRIYLEKERLEGILNGLAEDFKALGLSELPIEAVSSLEMAEKLTYRFSLRGWDAMLVEDAWLVHNWLKRSGEAARNLGWAAAADKLTACAGHMQKIINIIKESSDEG